MTLDAADLFLNITSDVDEIFGNLSQIGNLTFFYNDTVSTDGCVINITRIFYVRDEGCEVDNCIVGCPQIVTVVDTTPPNITCPLDEIIDCIGNDTDTSPAATGNATATDTCDDAPNVTYTDRSEDGCGNTGNITRTWTATDNCGNAASCDQVIIVEDTMVSLWHVALICVTI